MKNDSDLLLASRLHGYVHATKMPEKRYKRNDFIQAMPVTSDKKAKSPVYNSLQPSEIVGYYVKDRTRAR